MLHVELHKIGHKCCHCKLSATQIIFWHAITSVTNLALLHKPGTMRFNVAGAALGIFIALSVPYITDIWFRKKSIYKAPLLMFYMISMMVVNVTLALPGVYRWFLDVVLAIILYFVNIYFVSMLYSLFVRMGREELDVLREQ